MDIKKLERHQRFWQPLEKGEGGYLYVTSPMSDTEKPPFIRKPKDLEDYWLNTEYRVQRAEHTTAAVFHGQDAIQREFVNLGPGVQASFFGAPYELNWDSVWFDRHPIIKDFSSPVNLNINTDNELYKIIDQQTSALCENSNGRYAVSVTDIGGTLDVLFSLRGQELLMDLLDYPEEVLAAINKVDDEFIKYYNHLNAIIEPYNIGHTAWIPLVHNKPWYPIQCDFSVMISPAMFEEFVLPSLYKVSKALGQAVYHLDGPEQINHLDMILSLPNIHAIQWVPLPDLKQPDGSFVYNFASEQSIGVFKRILAAGKKLYIMGIPANQIETVFNEIGSDGVFMHTDCGSRKQADELIELCRKNWLKL